MDVDFTSDDLSNGRIGLRYLGSRFIYRETGIVIVYNADLVSEVDGTVSYDVEGNLVTVTTEMDGTVVIAAEAIGITIEASVDRFVVNSTAVAGVGELCGLCATADGRLRFRNGTVANINDLTEVLMFVESYLVSPADQFLRDQTRQCGESHMSRVEP